MCTLILAWQVFEDTPIVAAANRDEALGRPSRPPTVLDGTPAVTAPLDEEAGGTWIGYNEDGLFVAITNRRTDLVGERSRGWLVRDALGRASAADALTYVHEELDEHDYAGFNLVVADDEEATLLEWDGTLESTALESGVHVVVNEGHDSESEKKSAIRDALQDVRAPDAASWFDAVIPILRDHGVGTCIHGEGYGTRSSSLIAVDSDGQGNYRFADGPPCRTDYQQMAPPEGQV